MRGAICPRVRKLVNCLNPFVAYCILQLERACAFDTPFPFNTELDCILICILFRCDGNSSRI